ncbi:hypothetical protein [Streptomyces sp. PU-14G]|uniref:hypothetical protein n=1 Tax=Streptomyces sp. PU-14G TaxID=2800808 RepID=UPI0034DE82EB
MDSGLPKSLVTKTRDISWYEHARNYIEMKWTDSPASTRRTLAEAMAMATVTPALVKDTKGMPDARTVRTALYSWAFVYAKVLSQSQERANRRSEAAMEERGLES